MKEILEIMLNSNFFKNEQIKTSGIAIIINGTSCAGKSTLANELLTSLEKFGKCILIECDEIENKLKPNSESNPSLEKQARGLALSLAKEKTSNLYQSLQTNKKRRLH